MSYEKLHEKLTAEEMEELGKSDEDNRDFTEKLFELSEKHDIAFEELYGFVADARFEKRVRDEIAAGHDRHVEEKPPLPLDEVAAMEDYEHGKLMEIDKFIEDVKSGCITDYDGFGEFVSGDGRKCQSLIVNLDWLEEFRDEWPYVAWYNK